MKTHSTCHVPLMIYCLWFSSTPAWHPHPVMTCGCISMIYCFWISLVLCEYVDQWSVVHVCLFVCVCVCVCVCMCVCVYVCVCVCIYVCVWVCVCVYHWLYPDFITMGQCCQWQNDALWESFHIYVKSSFQYLSSFRPNMIATVHMF